MKLKELIIAGILLFVAGTLAGRQIEREQQTRAPAPVHITQPYQCYHAIITGHYAHAKGCV